MYCLCFFTILMSTKSPITESTSIVLRLMSILQRQMPYFSPRHPMNSLLEVINDNTVMKRALCIHVVELLQILRKLDHTERHFPTPFSGKRGHDPAGRPLHARPELRRSADRAGEAVEDDVTGLERDDVILLVSVWVVKDGVCDANGCEMPGTYGQCGQIEAYAESTLA